MDINDEVRFRVSPDLIGHPTKHIPGTKTRNIVSRSKGAHAKHWSNIYAKTHSNIRYQAVVNSKGLIELDLSGKQLRDIPVETYELGRLEILYTQRNHISKLSKSIAKLHRLRKLDASFNEINTVPDTIANLKHLQELNLSHNKLKTLPDNLGSLWELRSLNLGDNQFENLPNSICNLNSLRVLELPHNGIWHIPLSFQQLSSLRQLSLAENKFDQVPISICYLHHLEGLDLHGNKLISLPPDFDQLTKLKELNISHNKLQKIPQSLLELKHLSALDVSYNQLTTLPARMDRLHRLRVLNAHANALRSLPNNMPNLDFLNIAHNAIMNFSVAMMKKLRHLNANSNKLENMPLGVYNLSKLEVIKLARNSIFYLSQDIILLKELKQLDLSYNQLVSLPQVINDLEKLEAFNVKGNHLEEKTVHKYGFPSQGHMPRSWQHLNGHREANQKSMLREFGQNGSHGGYHSEPNLTLRGLKPEHQLYYPQHQVPNVGTNYSQEIPPNIYTSTPNPQDLIYNGHIYTPVHRSNVESKSSKKSVSKWKQFFSSNRKKAANKAKPHGRTLIRERPPLDYIPAADFVRMNTFYRNRPDIVKSGTVQSNTSGIDTMPSGSTRYTVNKRRRSKQPSFRSANVDVFPTSSQAETKPPFDPLESLRLKSKANMGVKELIEQRRSLNEPVEQKKEHRKNVADDSEDDANSRPRIYRSYFRNGAAGTIRSLNSLAYSDDTRPTPKYPGYFAHRPQSPWLTSGRKRYSSTGSVSTLDSSTGATVAYADTIGDDLSLGDEDFAYQPTSVSDNRLVGMVSDVESLLNDQLIEPINEKKESRGGIFKKGMNLYGTVKTLRGMSTQRRHKKKSSSLYGSVRSLSSTKSDSELYDNKRRTRVMPQKNDIMLKRPEDVTEIRNERFHSKEERFRVAPSGGLFRSSLDHNVSVCFPLGALDFPITISMQVEKVQQHTVEAVRLAGGMHLSNLLSVGHIVHLKQSHDIEFLHQVSITIPVPPSESRGRLHVLTLDRQGNFSPCTSAVLRNRSYITLKAWHLGGKVAVLTKSRDKFKACDAMEEFMRLKSGT